MKNSNIHTSFVHSALKTTHTHIHALTEKKHTHFHAWGTLGNINFSLCCTKRTVQVQQREVQGVLANFKVKKHNKYTNYL